MDSSTISAPATVTATMPQRMASLRGRVAVVTGSTSGIGLGVARALAAAGADVMLNGFGDPHQLDELRGGIAAEFGIRVGFVGADLSRAAGVEALIEQTLRELGPVDILVNNAGIQHVAPIDAFPLEKWDQIIALNLSAAFVATRAVLGGMKTRGWGRIVNMASAHGLVASPFKSAYVAAKHGLVGLTKVTALEAAEFGVTCNAVCPGYVWTPLVEKQIADQARVHQIAPSEVLEKVMLTRNAIKRLIEPEDVASLVTFLCRREAWSITGTAQTMDAGWLAH